MDKNPEISGEKKTRPCKDQLKFSGYRESLGLKSKQINSKYLHLSLLKYRKSQKGLKGWRILAELRLKSQMGMVGRSLNRH